MRRLLAFYFLIVATLLIIRAFYPQ